MVSVDDPHMKKNKISWKYDKWIYKYKNWIWHSKQMSCHGSWLQELVVLYEELETKHLNASPKESARNTIRWGKLGGLIYGKQGVKLVD